MKQLAVLTAVLSLAACADAGTAPPAADPPAVASTAEVQAHTGTTGFCAAGEVVVFGCRGDGGRVDAVCASPDLSADQGQLQYRLGDGAEAGRSTLVYPADGTSPATAFRGGTLMYSGGGGAFLRFDHQGQVYTLFTGIGRGWDKAGVAVQPADGGAAVVHACHGKAESTIGPALFDQAGIPEDPAGFEIP